MAKYQFITADVFTDVIFGGNQLAVFPDAQGIGDAQMQQIAQEFNLSETTFVLPAENPRYTKRVRIFTPAAEMPFAGHPTIGTAYVLTTIGIIPLTGENTEIVFEEGVGPVPVSIFSQAGKPVSAMLTAAQLPETGPNPPDAATIAKTLSLNEKDLLKEAWSPAGYSCGIPFLFVPVRDRDALARATFDHAHWKTHLKSFWAPHPYVFCFDPERQGSDLRARMFAPALGVEEDPATGAAAAALAGYLGIRDTTSNGMLHWTVEQGFEMGRPSILKIQADKAEGRIVAVRVSGQAVLVSEGTIEVPD